MTFVDAVVIPAAGAGSRFNELGKQYPKCCLPYQEKPIIRHIVERTMHLGKEVRIITSNQEQEDAIRYALELNGKIDKEIKFFKVDLSLVQGPATSLYAGLHDLDTAIVFLSDAIPVLPDSLDHSANKVYTSIVPDWARWCMVKTVDSHSIKFFDKPQDRRRPTLQPVVCIRSRMLKIISKHSKNYNTAEKHSFLMCSKECSIVMAVRSKHLFGMANC